MNAVISEPCATTIPDIPNSRPPGWPFIATSLDFWFTNEPDRFARDCQIDDTVFRRLDPEYYAWLRSRMALAKNASAAGRLDAEAFETLRLRFNTLHEWAVGQFGEIQLLAGLRAFDPGDYRPPKVEDTPRRSPIPGAPKMRDLNASPEAVAAVDAIRERALSLGWKLERLYGDSNAGIFAARRSLTFLLNTGDQVGEVTAQSIEIILAPPSDVRQRFYNPDVEQPWVRRVK